MYNYLDAKSGCSLIVRVRLSVVSLFVCYTKSCIKSTGSNLRVTYDGRYLRRRIPTPLFLDVFIGRRVGRPTAAVYASRRHVRLICACIRLGAARLRACRNVVLTAATSLILASGIARCASVRQVPPRWQVPGISNDMPPCVDRQVISSPRRLREWASDLRRPRCHGDEKVVTE